MDREISDEASRRTPPKSPQQTNTVLRPGDPTHVEFGKSSAELGMVRVASTTAQAGLYKQERKRGNHLEVPRSYHDTMIVSD